MLVLGNGDKLQADSTNASEVDYCIFGLDNNVLTLLGNGQLAASKADIFTANSSDVISVITIVNTGVAHNHINLYLLPSAGTARRIIAKDFQLEPGYSLHFEGGKVQILSPTGVSGGGDPSYIMTFDNTSLVAGVLTVTHNFGHQYPGFPSVTDNNGKVIIPDEITFTTANAFTVDLSSYGVISGTWRVVVLDSGASTAADAVSDIAYAASWDGITTIAPSKNAVYDAFGGVKLAGTSGKIVTVTQDTALDEVVAMSSKAPKTDTIKGDGVAGRVLRRMKIRIENGTNATTIKCSTTSDWQGDTNGAVDNIALGANVSFWTLNVGGYALNLGSAGITGDAVAVISISFTNNLSGVPLCCGCYVGGGAIGMSFSVDGTGVGGVLTTLVDTGLIDIDITYLTSA